jgi:hypothetical protein
LILETLPQDAVIVQRFLVREHIAPVFQQALMFVVQFVVGDEARNRGLRSHAALL